MTDSTKQKQTAGQSMRSTMNALVESAKPATEARGPRPAKFRTGDRVNCPEIGNCEITAIYHTPFGYHYNLKDDSGNEHEMVMQQNLTPVSQTEGALTEQPLSIPSNDEIEASLVDAVRWTISVEVAGQGYRSADVIGNLKKTVKRTMQEQGYPQVSTPFVQEKQVRVPPFMFD